MLSQRMNGLHPRTGSMKNLGDGATSGATPNFPETFRCAQKRANSKSPISQMSRQNNLKFCQPAGNTETDKYAQVDKQKYGKPMACLMFQNQKSTHCLTRFWTIEQLKTSNVQRKASIKHQTYKEPVKTSVLVSPSVSRLVKKFLQNDNQTTWQLDNLTATCGLHVQRIENALPHKYCCHIVLWRTRSNALCKNFLYMAAKFFSPLW